MAYPFGPPIAFASFLQRLVSQHGCQVRRATKLYRDTTSGEVTGFQYLFRQTAKGPRVAAIPEQEPTVDLMPSVVRSICRQLDVDNTAFGVLSDLDDDDDDDDA